MTVRREEFAATTAPFRAELLAHCYRMTGSVHDAEDLVQETLLRAWRSFDGFEQRASVRTWLHRIATNACLNALERGPARRVLPAGLGLPSDRPDEPLVRAGREVSWLEPIPDRLVPAPDDPSSVVVDRERTRLAFVAALQYLPARQRAVLILRDVLVYPAADVATQLDMTVAAVNGALRRARQTMAEQADQPDLDEPGDPRTQALVDRYVWAFEAADMSALAALLTRDAQVQMPPYLTWFCRRAAITDFLGRQVTGPGQVRLVATRANGQPALATFVRRANGTYGANSVHVLAIRSGRIQSIVAFIDAGLVELFAPPPD